MVGTMSRGSRPRFPYSPHAASHPGVSGAFVRDTLRCWLHGWKRFVSLMVITALGVAVLTGIYAGCRDMLLAADRFYDAQGLHDVQVMSTYGLTDDDVAALRRVEGVAAVQPERTQSVETLIDGTAKTVTMSEIRKEGLDRPHLSEGRMPSKAGEIAVTKEFLLDGGYALGDELTVTPVESDASASVLAASSEDASDGASDGGGTAPSFPTELTIVGEVIDPKDLSNPDGIGTEAFRSSATSDYTFFAPSDGVEGDVYTAVGIAVEGAKGEDSFSDDYDDLVNEVADRIEDTVRKERQRARRNQLVADAQDALDRARADADARFAAAQDDIDANRAELDAQRAALAAAVGADAASARLADALARIDDAQRTLDDSRDEAAATFDERQQDIDAVADARWYVQTRSSIDGFSSLDADVSSIESIGRAFPIVFLLVAVLMSLTSMTRMVEEERGLIGTYVGLGYGHAAIAARYVLFALLACLMGGGVGLIAGFVGIPAFLLVVLEGLYMIPDLRLAYDWVYGTGGVALFVVGVVAATAVACMGELRQTPAALMRPKAPKAGTRVLLERVRPLWRRMSFLNKVTVRNIARFKSRLIMTVGGVAGCTALIVCGLAINDSVDTIGVKQYQDIVHYDLMVVAGDDDADAMRARLDEDGRTVRTLDARIENGELDAGDAGESVQLLVVPDDAGDDLSAMVDLRDAAGAHEEIKLGGASPSSGSPSSGVILDQSAANALDVRAGDVVTLRDGSMRTGEATVSAVTRNLIGSNVTMSVSAYRHIFGMRDDDAVTLNARLAVLEGDDDDANIDYAADLARDPAVLSATSTARLQRSFQFELMAAVVALIVGLAGGLALVVLFTLSNTNVSERVREMATLKVLGFHDKEIHTYVNKEMMILTALGILVGLPLGRWIGGLLTTALAMPGIYFEVEVRWTSYLIAAGVTLVFSLLVQLLTNPVLDRIDPVSSLKSVE